MRIYINNCLLHILPPGDVKIPTGDLILPLEAEKLKDKIDFLFKSEKTLTAWAIDDRPMMVLHEIRQLFKNVEAAGGIVFNPQNEVLVIRRHNKWDLPKGKLEKGETTSEGAIREVQEECALKNVENVEFFQTTWHAYTLGSGNRALKPSHWYLMVVPEGEEPKPQLEESITEVKWVPIDKLKSLEDDAFPTIADLFRTVRKQQTEIVEKLIRYRRGLM